MESGSGSRNEASSMTDAGVSLIWAKHVSFVVMSARVIVAEDTVRLKATRALSGAENAGSTTPRPPSR